MAFTHLDPGGAEYKALAGGNYWGKVRQTGYDHGMTTPATPNPDPNDPSAIQTDSIQSETDDDTPDPDAPDYATALTEGGQHAPARPAGSGSPTRVVGTQS